MKTQISIRLARDEERKAAIEYISNNMRKKHGSCPPKNTTPPYLFLAFEGDAIVGSLGILFGSKNTLLPIEELFQFEYEKAPIRYVREKTMYYSRWNSSRQGIGPAIWLAASLYAQRQGIIYTTQTIKDVMLERYRAFGCTWHAIPNAKIRKENIGETERDYFFNEHTPRPWVGILRQQIKDLPRIVEDSGARARICFE